MVAEWLSSWLAEQEVQGSTPCLATWISEIGYLLLPSRDMAEIPLKPRKFSIQPTNQAIVLNVANFSIHINGDENNWQVCVNISTWFCNNYNILYYKMVDKKA